jgi:hypothetical protein
MVAVGSTYSERGPILQSDGTVAVRKRAQRGNSVQPDDRRPMNAEEGSWREPLLQTVQ